MHDKEQVRAVKVYGMLVSLQCWARWWGNFGGSKIGR